MNLLDAMLQADVAIPSVAEWCRLNGVEPRTFYRHRARVAAEGAWIERSRHIQIPLPLCFSGKGSV